jgi:hypothetical protein
MATRERHSYASGDRRPGFDQWMKQVDRECWKAGGCSIHDLPDVPFADWHEDGKSPAAAAKKAIRLAKGYGEMYARGRGKERMAKRGRAR